MSDDEVMREIRGSDAERLLLSVTESQEQYFPSDARALFEGDSAAASWADEQLERLGLVSAERSLADEITATPRGRAVASRILQSRADGPERWDRVARAIATSLIQTGGWRIDEADGAPVTEAEERLAIQHLKQWNLVKAQPRADGKIHVVLPLDRIHEVPGITGLLRDFYEGVPSYNDHRNTTTIQSSTVGVVQTGGHHNTQNVSQTITTTQQAEALVLVGSLLAALNRADDVDDLREAVEGIRVEVSRDDATKSTVKDKVMGALITAGASESGHLISQGLAQLLSVLAGWA